MFRSCFSIPATAACSFLTSGCCSAYLRLAADSRSRDTFSFLTNSTTGSTTQGFANPIGSSDLQFQFTPSAALDEGEYLVSAVVKVFDEQRDSFNSPDPAMGRSDLSAPLLMTIDVTAVLRAGNDALILARTAAVTAATVIAATSPLAQNQGG